MPRGLTTSSDAPVSDWLRMRQAIVRPLNSMLPDFKALHSNSALPRLPQSERTVGSPANKALTEARPAFDPQNSSGREVAKLSRFDCSSVKRFWTNCRSSSVRLVYNRLR
jgi:hypothetical protein